MSILYRDFLPQPILNLAHVYQTWCRGPKRAATESLVGGGGPNLSKIKLQNAQVREMVQTLIGVAAYVGAVFIAPYFRCRIPTWSLVIGGLAFPEAAFTAITIHLIGKGCQDGWNYSQAGMTSKAVESIAVGAMAYISTMPIFQNFKNNCIYQFVPGYLDPYSVS